MGRSPAVVIVARYLSPTTYLQTQKTHKNRHGARLDAADSQWHLTSPTPYDPPLTYGGWRQSQALGARIASIINDHENAAGSSVNRGPIEMHHETKKDGRIDHRTQKGKRRRHQVVIHTSPFLRCVQTSIAISAGMAQYQGASNPTTDQTHAKPHLMHSGSPRIHAVDHHNSPRLSAIPEPGVTATSRRSTTSKGSRGTDRTLLRVDAFLGEWLSPDYFDKITPPPGSKMMLASAKGDLHRRGEPIDMAQTSNRNASGNFPGGWGSGGSVANGSYSSDEETPLADFSSISQSLPRISRANSHYIGNPSRRSNLKAASRVEGNPAPERSAYVAPTPSYAVSPSQPIPPGYVAHARDACVKVDYQWDSMRLPLEWGNGGEYGEEWSSMHMRFRRGLHEMITWYRYHDPSETLETISGETCESRSLEISDDDDVNTVLVLVTHGAGCNALIGALTNQPVLIDVGTASLTMAVRKSVDYRRVASPTQSRPSASPPRRRQSVVDFGISDDYEVKLVASTEHLRAGSQFLNTGSKLQRTPSLPVREKSPYRYERPGFASPLATTSSAHHDEFHSSHGSATLTKTGFERLQKSATAVRSSSSGLWSMPVSKKVEDSLEKNNKQPSQQAVQNAPVKVPLWNGTSKESDGEYLANSAPEDGALDAKHVKSSPDNDGQGHSIVRTGLWGAPPQALGTDRDKGAKRRWTVSQAA